MMKALKKHSCKSLKKNTPNNERPTPFDVGLSVVEIELVFRRVLSRTTVFNLGLKKMNARVNFELLKSEEDFAVNKAAGFSCNSRQGSIKPKSGSKTYKSHRNYSHSGTKIFCDCSCNQRLPIGAVPISIVVNKLITRPRKKSGIIDWIAVLIEATLVIIKVP